MTDVPSDELFQTLPHLLRRRIDDAFQHALEDGSPRKRRKISTNAIDVPMTGGGFIPEETGGGGFIAEGGGFIQDDPMPSGGGFILDDDPMFSGGGFLPKDTPDGGFLRDEDPTPTANIDADETIALSSIPSLLGSLGLDPDDEEVMQVFRNAATGWSNTDSSKAENSDLDGRVSKEDWRSVCAVLLESQIDDADVGDEYDEEQDVAQDDERDDSDDVYEGPDQSDSSDEDGDDEYTDKPARKPSRRRKMNDSGDESDVPFELTPAQKRACARDFERFFAAFEETSKSITAAPEKRKPVASGSQDNTTIRIKHIQHVASLLGEKLKAEDIVEMLSAFSSAPDKTSVSLADFEKIMVEAKLA